MPSSHPDRDPNRGGRTCTDGAAGAPPHATRPGRFANDLLVLGARSFIGSRIVSRARDRGLRVVAAARGPGGPATLDCDVLDPERVREVLREVRPRWRVNASRHGDASDERALERLCPEATRDLLLVAATSAPVPAVPRGTAGALALVEDRGDELLVINGDVLTDLRFTDVVRTHRRTGAALTLATQRRQTQMTYGVVETDGERAVRRRRLVSRGRTARRPNP